MHFLPKVQQTQQGKNMTYVDVQSMKLCMNISYMDINRLLQSDILSAVIKQAVLNKQTNNKISTTPDGPYIN